MAHKNLFQILAVRASALPSILQHNTGFYQMGYDAIKTMLEGKSWWGPRGDLENDESFRQIIPYVVLRHQGRFATYTRGEAGGEARLHGKMSIGLGGHIDIGDNWLYAEEGVAVHTDLMETTFAAADRELSEEVTYPGGIGLRGSDIAGLLIDNSNEVGRVHLGVVFIIDIDDPTKVLSNEPDITHIQWLTRDELMTKGDRLEGWTSILLVAQ